MATIHTPLPENREGHYGEYLVGQKLKTFSNPSLELWFDVDYIPGVTDIDLILFDNQAGYYLIEIKSMPLDAITTFNMTEFKVNKEKKAHPISQVRTSSNRLRTHLQRLPKFRRAEDLPFFQSSIMWSEITRQEWRARFRDPALSGFVEMCLFKDDIETYNKMINRLQIFWDLPLLGVTVPKKARGEHAVLDAFREAIKPSHHRTKISKPMTEELARPVSESKRIADKYPIGKSHKVSLQGAPGTGKTTILREIGLRYLSKGGRVLHVCFNKVLAADQKREYQFLRKKVEEYGFIDVFDIWELYKTLGHSAGIRGESQVVENVTAYLNSDEGKQFLKYDVILIDESQDLRDDFFRVVELIAQPNAAWFVAYGKGQETNNFLKDETHPSPWLTTYLEEADPNHLKRSFRNSTRAFLLAQSFWEKFPDISNAKEWIELKFSQISISDNQFELELRIPQTKNDFKVEFLPTGVRKRRKIRSLVLTAIEDSRRASRGEDLLVAVLAPSIRKPDENENPIQGEYEIVKEVLTNISTEFGLDFNDLVPKDARREIPNRGAIRLVTLQGIRGLSASHVIVFDLLKLEKWCKRTSGTMKPPLNNLAYIALSRSKASTIIALDDSEDSEIEPFLMELLGYATELTIKQGNK